MHTSVCSVYWLSVVSQKWSVQKDKHEIGSVKYLARETPPVIILEVKTLNISYIHLNSTSHLRLSHHAHRHARTHTHTYTHARTHAHIHTHTHTHRHAHRHAHTHTHARACTHACTHTHAHTHTHTHIHVRTCVVIVLTINKHKMCSGKSHS